MIKLKRTTVAFYCMVFIMMLVCGLWLVNDAYIGKTLYQIGIVGGVMNGFWFLTVDQAYHIGLWLAMLGGFFSLVFNIYLILNHRRLIE